MPALGDKYVLTLTSHEGANIDNPFINVFAYEATEGEPSAVGCAGAFISDVVPALQAVLSAATTIDQAQVINLDDDEDFATTSIGVVGTISGQYLPRFNGWEFEYLRGTRLVHNGRKTFSLVPESAVTDGNLDAGYLGYIVALELALASAITTGGTPSTWVPRIWRRAGTYSGVEFTDHFYPIYGVEYRRVSTQNSRKR